MQRYTTCLQYICSPPRSSYSLTHLTLWSHISFFHPPIVFATLAYEWKGLIGTLMVQSMLSSKSLCYALGAVASTNGRKPRSLREAWIAQIQTFPRVSHSMAKSICASFPSCKALLKAFEQAGCCIPSSFLRFLLFLFWFALEEFYWYTSGLGALQLKC